MKSTPILFKAEMVRAILGGRKTQTRRIMKDQPSDLPLDVDVINGRCFAYNQDGRYTCPYGGPGDQIWVKETFACENPAYVAGYKAEPWRGAPDPDTARIFYAADLVHQNIGIRWRPSIFMPRWASRITLEVTGVRVERLQDISAEDAIAEGVERKEMNDGRTVYAASEGNWSMSPRDSYRALWQSINGPGSWDENPWVWVVEFKRLPAESTPPAPPSSRRKRPA